MRDPNAEQTNGQLTVPPHDQRMDDRAPTTGDYVIGNESRNGEVAELVLPLVNKLRDALRAQHVNYCQWKGHWKRHRWATGEGDIDLLVSRAHVQRLTSALSQLGFKQALPPSGMRIPGVWSYYGFDYDAERFVHVHVHYQLVLGRAWETTYHLPIEEPFLDSAADGSFFRIPAPEFELIVLVLRTMLGCSLRDFILRHRKASFRVSQEELAYLERRVDRGKVYEVLKRHLACIDAALFERCVRSLRPDCAKWKRLAVGHQLRRCLKAHARRPQLTATVRRLGQRLLNMATGGRAFLQPSRMRFATGGAIIAITGGDGAGKSTCVEKVCSWLTEEFDVIPVHLGKPPRSLTTLVVGAPRKVARWLRGLLSSKPTLDPLPDRCPAGPLGYLDLLREVCNARDRYRLYVQARRFAMRGGLVICDRYPLPQLKKMDGAIIAQLVPAELRHLLLASLRKAETWYYRHILPPDLLIVLRVHPEVAARRKTNEEANYVRGRSREIWELDWRQTEAHVVDATPPVGEVCSCLQSLIWAHL
jgi:thymidylate kinase